MGGGPANDPDPAEKKFFAPLFFKKAATSLEPDDFRSNREAIRSKV
jgi:hypothetical protein